MTTTELDIEILHDQVRLDVHSFSPKTWETFLVDSQGYYKKSSLKRLLVTLSKPS